MRRTRRGSTAQVFVLGIQKAGTTAIATLLARATGNSLTSDFMHHEKDMEYRLRVIHRDVPFDQFLRKNRKYLSRAIVKDPNLSFFYDELVEHFPDAKFVFISRDPRDNIRSTLNWMKLPGNLEDLGPPFEHHPYKFESWKLMIEGKFPPVGGNTYIERLANRWKLAVDSYLRHRDRIALIRYEDFMKDKAAAITSLAREVGLEPSCDVTKDLDVQYQPRGNREVTWNEFFGAPNLHRIEDLCAPEMEQLGYCPLDSNLKLTPAG